MNNLALKVDNVGKSYTSYKSNWGRIGRWFGLPTKPSTEFWACNGVSFELNRGEAIALIGQNGAGKSTVLKLITGTTRPTIGSVMINGTIGSILELGLGFNPEFSGRENIYQAGGLLGFSHEKLSQLMPEIESFSELGDFFDQPFRVYSSGMQARLAFSLVTASRPDILIVDEILSVGDSYFQHKSFDRIREFKAQGTTIILVSHSLGDVRSLCDRVILLDKGKVLRDGLPDEVIDQYNALIAEKENSKLTVTQRRIKGGWLHSEFGTMEAKVANVDLFDQAKMTPVSTVAVGQKLVFRTEVEINGDVPRLVLGHRITDKAGHIVWGSNTWHTKQLMLDLKAGDHVTYELEFSCNLGPGSYSLNFGLVSTDTHLSDCYHKGENQLVFDVVNMDRPIFIGSSALDARFSTKHFKIAEVKRLAVVSTPRSGNTWLTRMLAALYNATIISIHHPDDIKLAEFKGQNLVVQLHWLPTEEFLKFLNKNGFEVVTLTRHPLDVLLSILQFSPGEPQTANWLAGEGGDESSIYNKEPNSPEFLQYATSERSQILLGVSDAWAQQSNVNLLRYEDLVENPIAVMSSLVDKLGQPCVDLNEVVTSLTFERQKGQHTENNHFWQGKSGLWRTAFSQDSVALIFQAHSDLIARMGYQVDEESPPRTEEELKNIWTELCQ